MNRNIYHGSSHIVRKPAFGAGNAYNDFGLGFYCSESASGAASWAVGRDSSGFVSAYSIDDSGLRIINLCSSQYTALHWLYVLMNFREFDSSSRLLYRARDYINANYYVDYQGCDCIIGWRADDCCFAFAQDFLSDKISYQSLVRALSSDPSNRQFVLKSNRAFDRITCTGYEPVSHREHYPAAHARELRQLKGIRPVAGRRDLFISRLIEEEVRPYDTRLR